MCYVKIIRMILVYYERRNKKIFMKKGIYKFEIEHMVYIYNWLRSKKDELFCTIKSTKNK